MLSSIRWVLIVTFLLTAVCASDKEVAGADVPRELVPYDAGKAKAALDKLVVSRDETIRELLKVLRVAASIRARYEEVDRRKLAGGSIEEIQAAMVAQSMELSRLGVRRPREKEHEHIAILMLGALRAAEAVEPLLERVDINYEPGFFPSSMMYQEPVPIRALVSIGKPASKGAVEALKKNNSERRVQKLVRVIALVEGSPLGREMVRLAIQEEKDPKSKARLEEALKLFKELKLPRK